MPICAKATPPRPTMIILSPHEVLSRTNKPYTRRAFWSIYAQTSPKHAHPKLNTQIPHCTHIRLNADNLTNSGYKRSPFDIMFDIIIYLCWTCEARARNSRVFVVSSRLVYVSVWCLMCWPISIARAVVECARSVEVSGEAESARALARHSRLWLVILANYRLFGTRRGIASTIICKINLVVRRTSMMSVSKVLFVELQIVRMAFCLTQMCI